MTKRTNTKQTPTLETSTLDSATLILMRQRKRAARVLLKRRRQKSGQ